MLKNIFLDVDGVVLNKNNLENPSAEIITKIIKRYNQNYSIKDYWNDINEAVYRFAPNVYEYTLYNNIKNHFEFYARSLEFKKEIGKLDNKFILMEGIHKFLEIFSEFYKIGIMGGYKYTFPNFLKEKNLFQYITYNERPDNWFLYKPDIRYFEEVLQKCNCNPYESIMIGDRIDEDIIPAMRIGMRTVRIKTGIYKRQEPRLPIEKANITVERIDELTIEIIKTMDYGA